MVEIKKKDLCFVGSGDKIHIKYNNRFTYCASELGNPLKEKGLIALTEKARELCRNCLREYKKCQS